MGGHGVSAGGGITDWQWQNTVEAEFLRRLTVDSEGNGVHWNWCCLESTVGLVRWG